MRRGGRGGETTGTEHVFARPRAVNNPSASGGHVTTCASGLNERAAEPARHLFYEVSGEAAVPRRLLKS